MPRPSGRAVRPRTADEVADEVIELAARHREVFAGRVVKMTRLTPLELRLLMGIHRLPGATIEQIGEHVNASPQTLRHALMELRDEKKLVGEKEHTDEKGQADKRRRNRFLTAKGRKLLADFAEGYERDHRR